MKKYERVSWWKWEQKNGIHNQNKNIKKKKSKF
jgi:hypothetical protein